MNLQKIIEGIEIISMYGEVEKEIKSIEIDSRCCKENCLFIAIKGYRSDGHNYIEAAIKKGASVIVYEEEPKEYEDGITYIHVEDSRKTQSILANRLYDTPSNKLWLLGVTGTNGKTSVAFLVSNILRFWGKNVGNIGTIGNYLGDTYIESKLTTPEASDLQKVLSQMVELGIEYTAMEVSSHSLSLRRVEGTHFDIGVFTNLSQDHLDFHKSFDNYFHAKLKLFAMTEKANVINGDDFYGKKIIKVLKDKGVATYSYGIEHTCDFMAKNIKIDNKGVAFTIVGKSINESFHTSIPGLFSVYNAMAAIIVGYIEQIPMGIIKAALEDVAAVPGRFEVVPTNRPYSIIIDYAHTPDGLENVLKTIGAFSKKRIITVFGCGGDRDKTKRSIMGNVVGQYSSFSIITSDNPRSEEPLSIINDIIPGVEETKCPFRIIEDRKEAIKTAIAMAQKDDIILIAGKGHETYQILKEKIIPFDEKKIIKELLGEDE